MGGYKYSAPACYGSSLGSNPDISQKCKMVDISKGVANTLQLAKKNLSDKRYRGEYRKLIRMKNNSIFKRVARKNSE
jgi:hypothetical protein